jgi:hypothetical protein
MAACIRISIPNADQDPGGLKKEGGNAAKRHNLGIKIICLKNIWDKNLKNL